MEGREVKEYSLLVKNNPLVKLVLAAPGVNTTVTNDGGYTILMIQCLQGRSQNVETPGGSTC